jgi:tRNA(Met) cytidine acetyltransferase
VVRLRAAFEAGDAAPVQVVLADRGRGKSAGLGRALAGWGPAAALVGPHPAATATARAFAGSPPPACWSPAEALTHPAPRVLAIDEAAQLPLALLERLCARAAGSAVVLATTCHGYEGSGRGFVHRFLPALRAAPRGVEVHTLEAPVRWAPGDPLEAWVRALLLLDTELPPAPGPGAVTVRLLSQRALAADENALRAAWSLLVGAHPRTTPADLAHLLDAPGLALYAAEVDGVPAAVNLLSREGGLSASEAAAAVQAGRLPGQALADTLSSHAAAPAVLTWPLRRSVRVVTHPGARRRGLAAALVRAVEQAEPAALYGTVFGASPELLAFRRALGYRLVRVGVRRGEATGEPAAVMVRPADAAAAAVVDALQAALARNLDAILALLEADHGLPFSPAERAAFWAGLPRPQADPAAEDAAVAAYVGGAAPADAWAGDLGGWARRHAALLSAAPPPLPALVEGRLWAHRPWPEVAAAAGLSVPAAMRALRRGLRALAGLDGARAAPG